MRRIALFLSPSHILAALLLASGSYAEAAAPKAYVGNFGDNTVSVVDLVAGTIVATIPVSPGPHGMAMAQDGKMVYVSGDASANLDVIDTSTDRVTRTIEVGKAPHGLALTPDGRLLLVGVYAEGRIVFVDTATLAVAGSIAVPKPHTIAIHPNGNVAYVASQEPGQFALAVIDLKTRAVRERLPLEKAPRDLEFGYDGKALYYTQAGVNAVQVLDPVSDRTVAQIPTGVSPHIASLYRGAPGGTAVVQGAAELLLFDPATNSPLRKIAVGKQPHWIASADGGRKAVVTNEGSNDLSIVDLETGESRTVSVGKAPRKVVVQPGVFEVAAGTARISIANFAFSPGKIQVARGTRVSWTNDDGAPHGLKHADGSTGVDVLLPGAAATRLYDSPGTYDYFCSVHPYMAGRVVVGEH